MTHDNVLMRWNVMRGLGEQVQQSSAFRNQQQAGI